MSAFVSTKLGEKRKLGTIAGDVERQARKLARQGHYREAGSLRAQAATDRAKNRGFSSSEENIKEEQYLREGERQIQDQKNMMLLGDDQEPEEASPAGGYQKTWKGDQTPPKNLEQRKTLFEEMSKAEDPNDTRYRRSAESIGLTEEEFNRGVQKIAGTKNLEQRKTLFEEMSKAEDPNDALYRRSAESIGLTEEEFNRGVQKIAGAKNPKTFSADIATKNIEEKGVQGAIADYHERKKNQGIKERMSEPLDANISYKGSPRTDPTVRLPTRLPQANPINVKSPEQPTSLLGSINQDIKSFNFDENYGDENYGDERTINHARLRAGVAQEAYEKNTDPRLRGVLQAEAMRTGYQARMQPGLVSLSDIRGGVVSPVKRAVRGAQNFSDRTNAWAEEFRNRRK